MVATAGGCRLRDVEHGGGCADLAVFVERRNHAQVAELQSAPRQRLAVAAALPAPGRIGPPLPIGHVALSLESHTDFGIAIVDLCI